MPSPPTGRTARHRALALRAALTALTALVALGAACTVQIEERHVLFPWPSQLLPFNEEIARRNVEVPAEDGVVLRGWLLDVPHERMTVVFFYGNGQSTIDRSAELYTLAGELSADVICVDYRGYGFSDGAPTLAHLGQDGLRVFDHATGRAGGKPVVVMGYSLGSGAAVLVGARRPAAAVILVAPPASPRAMVEHMESRLPW